MSSTRLALFCVYISMKTSPVYTLLCILISHPTTGLGYLALKVLNLVVCAWQAIAAVTPSVLTASHRQSQGQSIPLQTAGILGLPVGAKGVRQVDEEAKRRALNAMGIESGASQCLGSGESRARAFVGGRGSTGRESDTAENTPEGMQSKDVFDDPLRALVRCLCGVVVRRWKEASSAGKSPKKVWVSHVMEAVLALTRAIEVSTYRFDRFLC